MLDFTGVCVTHLQAAYSTLLGVYRPSATDRWLVTGGGGASGSGLDLDRAPGPDI
jgi:hypothetical protein